jgi:hypothetical protein
MHAAPKVEKVGDNVNEALVDCFRNLLTFKTSILERDAVNSGVSVLRFHRNSLLPSSG